MVASALAAIAIIGGGTARAQPAQANPSSRADADDRPDSWFVRVAYTPARVLAASDFQSGGGDARAMTIEIGRQTGGGREWHRVYNYPAYGVGFYAARFGHDRELGRPLAAYGFFSWPFPLSPRTALSADLGIGVAWNWTAFDAATNPTNTALGSTAAYHVDGGVLLHYLVAGRASVYGGMTVTHWSNGATKQPNLGLAVIGPKIGVRYDFAPRAVPAAARRERPALFVPAWEFVAGLGGSTKNVVAAGAPPVAGIDRRRSFNAVNLTTGVQRHFYRFGRIAGGVDLTYDGAAGARVDVVDGREIESRAPADRRGAVGVFGGYEHVMARLSVLLQLGYAAWRGFDDPEVPRFYQRYGARFLLTDHLWSTFAVRAVKGRKASFMELGLGYRVVWRGDPSRAGRPFQRRQGEAERLGLRRTVIK